MKKKRKKRTRVQKEQIGWQRIVESSRKSIEGYKTLMKATDEEVEEMKKKRKKKLTMVEHIDEAVKKDKEIERRLKNGNPKPR